MVETNTMFKQADRRMADWEQRMDESDKRWEKRMAKVEQRMDESDKRWEKRMANIEQRVDESDKRWEKRMAKVEQRMDGSDKRFKEEHKYWNKRWGDLARTLGRIAEDIVAPNIPRLAKHHFGCVKLDDFMVRRKHWHSTISKQREFDVIAVCDNKVIINETKSTAKIDYINDFVDMLAEFTGYFPEYEGKTIIPIFASLHLSEEIVKYLSKKNIYAMAMGTETMELLNVNKVSLK
jgi:hypothetical protein